MTGSRRMFLTFCQAEKLEALSKENLRQYLVDRIETGISHDDWMESHRIGFPCRKYKKLSGFGVTLKDIQRLMDAIRDIKVHTPSVCAGLSPAEVESRIEDFYHMKIVDRVSVAQAIEFAARPSGSSVAQWSHLRSVMARYDEHERLEVNVNPCHCKMERRFNSNIQPYLGDRLDDMYGWD